MDANMARGRAAGLTLTEGVERVMMALWFTAAGLVTMTVFSPWHPTVPETYATVLRIGWILMLLGVAWTVRGSCRLRPHWPVCYGLAVLAIAVSLDRWVVLAAIPRLGMPADGPMGSALLKLVECVVVVGTVVVMTRLTGACVCTVYIDKGDWRVGLRWGLILFAVSAAVAVPLAYLQFRGADLTWARIRVWLPWLLLFCFASATLEELLFRGLFLKKLEPLYGPWGANALVMVLFTLLHSTVTYTSDMLVFLAALAPLALAWGWLMQKTRGPWASILFHAGMDIPILLGIFSRG